MKKGVMGMLVSVLVTSLLVAFTVAGHTQPAQKEPVKLGAYGPMSGPGASNGEAQTRGWKLAEEEINAAGGLLGGRPLKLIIYDSELKPEPALAAAKKLVLEDKVPLMFSAFSSTETLAVKRFSEETGVPHFVGIPVRNDILEGTRWAVRVLPNLSMFDAMWFDYIAKKIRPKSVSILHANGAFENSHTTNLAKFLEGIGCKVLNNEVFEHSSTDFRPYITKIKANNPEWIYTCTTAPANQVIIYRQYAELGLEAKKMHNWSGIFEEPLQKSGQYIEGTVTSDIWAWAMTDPQSEAFKKRYWAKYQSKCGYIPPVCYSQVYGAVTAINAAGTDKDCAKIMAALKQIDMNTVIPMRFDEKGENVKAKVLPMVVRNSEIIPIQ